MRCIVYHHCERRYSLRLMIYTFGDDIPLLSQWIKKFDKSKLVEFFGLPEQIRTVDLQSRSLTRYPAVPRVDCLRLIIAYYMPFFKTFEQISLTNFNIFKNKSGFAPLPYEKLCKTRIFYIIPITTVAM